MIEDYPQLIKKGVLNEPPFVRLILKGRIGRESPPYRKVVVRPVLLKGGRHLQFSYFDEKKDVTKNYQGAEAEQKLDEALALPFSHLHLETTTEIIQITVSKGGKANIHRTTPAQQKQPDLSHDKSKSLPLPPGKSDAFLQAVGIMNKQGQVIPHMADKLHQINEFLKLLEHTGELKNFAKTPVNILDCGSGSSYLSFATYHYLNDVLGISSKLIGIDTNSELVAKSSANSAKLGFGDISFITSSIKDYAPASADIPDIVLALHACDTATDDAIMQGVTLGAKLVLCVPCCHHHLHAQMHPVAPFEPVLREGILKKRLADILTDTFRVQALRIAGYKTDAIEFVSSEHTDRNLMIRAVKGSGKSRDDALREYTALKQFWGVTPYIDTLLSAEHLWPALAESAEM